MAIDEQRLIAAARAGDDDAFRLLVEPLRARLHAHCYRMLGSSHDAEDALQEALVRAWRGLDGFDGRSALGSWLYRIATNTCLNAIKKRPKRVLPIDCGRPSADPHDAAAEPLLESVWIEPYADGQLAPASPAGRYEQRESVELAFVAALQHLSANQRAALLLTDVLGDERVAAIVGRYMQAMEQGDVGALVALLAEDASWTMPPQPAWFRGRAAIAGFLAENPLRYFRWRQLPAQANGQPAVGSYSWSDERGSYVAHSLDVLTLRGAEIASVTSFLDVTRRGVAAPGLSSFVASGFFERFGLPSELAPG